jgi:hypothetical protein
MSIAAGWPQCLSFFGTSLVIEPSPGQLSGDAGLLPIRYFDQRIGLTQAFADALNDPRDLDLTEGFETIFLNHDRLDCRRENLKVVSKEEARRHHRVRSDSKSGVKGVRYNPESDSWSAYVYRHGHCYHVATYFTKEQAVATYEAALKNENPDLHSAPDRVERPSNLASTQQTGSNAD